jgi:hypothetical protein
MTQFLDYDATNPFSLMDRTAIRQIIDAMQHYSETRDRDPYLLALIQYAEQEADRQEALDDPPEAKLSNKVADILGVPRQGDAMTPDEYWAKRK